MAKTFAILSALILLISAIVAYKNQQLYVAEIRLRQETEANNERLRGNLEKLVAEVKTEEGTLAEAKADLKQREEAVAGQTQKNNEITAEVAAKRNEVATREAQVAEAEKSVGNREELNELVTKLKAQRAELATLSDEISTNEASLSNLTAENKRLDGVIAELREQTSWPVRKISNPKLRTTVSSSYPTWGFVTLSAGENAGVIAGSILEVKRDDATVARLLVTAVESSTSAADIIPDVANGPQAVVNPGDLVVAAAPSNEGVLRPSADKPALPKADLPPLEGTTPAAPLEGSGDPTAPAEAPAETPAEAPAAPAGEAADPFADFATPSGN